MIQAMTHYGYGKAEEPMLLCLMCGYPFPEDGAEKFGGQNVCLECQEGSKEEDIEEIATLREKVKRLESYVRDFYRTMDDGITMAGDGKAVENGFADGYIFGLQHAKTILKIITGVK